MIPVDSRFCSHCAADLRHTLNSFEMGSSAEAGTFVLNRRHPHHPTRRGHRDRTQAQSGGQRSRRRIRRPMLIIAAIFAISFFIIKRIVWNATVPAAPSPYDSGSVAPPGVVAPGGDIRDARLSALRQALDDAGYESVQFRMNGDTLELWGTVPSEFDRVNVQAIVFSTAGIALLRDNLRVHEVSSEP